jgi:multiple sugar transport system substrate-binding protein
MKIRTVVGLTAMLATGVAAVTGLGFAQGKKTITIGLFPDLDSVVKASLPGFLKTHPNLDVKLNVLQYAPHHDALTTALSTGSGANDVEAIDFGYVAKFAEGAGLEDLSKAPYNGNQYKARFVDYTYPQATTQDGRLVAIPTDIGPGTMFYRTDLLKKANVKPADLNRSWEDYITNGKKVMAANPGTFLIPDASDISSIVIRTNLASGEGLYFDKNNKVLVGADNPRFVRAFTLAKQVRDAKLDARTGGAFSADWTTAFGKGNLITAFSGAWLAGHMTNWLAQSTAKLWNVQQLPDNSFASWGGSFYGIPSQSKNKAEAWELIKYLTTNRDAQISAFRTTGAFPALKAAQTDAIFNEPVAYLADQKARLVWRTAAQRIKPIDVNRLDSFADQTVSDALGTVLDGSKDITTALNDAKALIERRAR